MPYIFVDDEHYDEDSMGAAADVVSRDDYSLLEKDRDELRTERDAAAERIGNLESELKESKDRYAKHVISAGAMVNRAKKDVIENGTAQSFKELFAQRTKG